MIPATVSGNTISNNDVGGNLQVVAEQKNFNLATNYSTPSNLPAFVERFRKFAETDDEYLECIEELSSLFHDVIPREIIGLEAKLLQGGRNDLIEEARFLENKIAMKIARNQFSRTAEAIYYHALTRIKTAFTSQIYPLIRSGVDQVVVDQAIYGKVILPIHDEIISVYAALDTEQIKGMLFYLTGKCRIQWA